MTRVADAEPLAVPGRWLRDGASRIPACPARTVCAVQANALKNEAGGLSRIVFETPRCSSHRIQVVFVRVRRRREGFGRRSREVVFFVPVNAFWK